jgi:LmbE family N-acetylglucosaminyl deacetylase
VSAHGAPPEALGAPPRGRVLCLAPHPDDEVIGCGGTLALHRVQGDEVRVVVAFDGRLGLDPGDDPALRCREARRAGAVLGLDDYVFLGHPEGHEPSTEELEAGARELAGLVGAWQPQLVYAPWLGEQHLDHRTLARAARLALEGFEGQVWTYEVWTPLVPRRVVDVSGVWDRKLDSLREHESQLARTDLAARVRGMGALRSVHLPSGSRYGEAFSSFDAGSAREAAA